MSDTRKDGVPAFPQNDLSGYGMGPAEINNGGMTLRDWFAGQWLAAGHHANLSPQEAAEQAYEYADAMIAARGSDE